MFEYPIKVPLGHGFFVGANFYLKAEATGEISAKASIESEIGTKYTKGHWSTYKDQTTEMSASLEAKGKLAVAPSATLLLASISIIDVAPEVGMQASGKTTVRDTGMVCNDLSANLYATLKVGAETDWMKLAGIGYSKDLWNKDNSPYKWRAHMEDGTFVDACTYGKDDPTNPGGSGGDESDASDFEYAVGDYWADFGDSSVHVGEIPEGEIDGTVWTIREGYGCRFQAIAEGGINNTWNYFDCGHGVYISNYCGDDNVVVIPDNIDGEKVVYAALELGEGQTLDVSQAKSLKCLFVVGGDGVNLGSSSTLQNVDIRAASGFINIANQEVLATLTLIGIYDIEGFEVDLSGNHSLRDVFIRESVVRKLDLSDCSKLSELVVGNLDLVSLDCSNCALAELDISELPLLSELCCQNNSIADTSALEVWLAEEGHSGAVNPQNT